MTRIQTVATVVTAAALSLALTDCTSLSSPATTIPAQYIVDASAALATLSAGVATTSATNPTLIPPATVTKIEADIATAQTALAQVSTSTTVAAGETHLQQIEAGINDTLTTLAAIPLIPQPLAGIVQAAALIAPEIEALIATVSPTTAPVATSAVAPTMSVQAARVKLGAATVN